MTAKKSLLDFAEGNLPSYAQPASGLTTGSFGFLEDTVNDPRFNVTKKKPYVGEIVT